MIVIVIPGTGVIYTVSVALGHGGRRGIVAAFACTLGIVPHLLAASFGLSGFMHAGALAFRALKYVGIAYLLFLAYTMLRSDPITTFGTHSRAATTSGTVIRRGILLNLLNPKLTLFFFAFLPPFLSVDAASQDLLGLGLVFMVLTFIVFAIYAVAAARVGNVLSERGPWRLWVQRSMAAALAAFAIKLALDES
jgi:threonine/homoserine/homoserine lactone efflux protein